MYFNGTVTSSISEDIFIHGTSIKIGHLEVSNPPANNFTDDILLSQDVDSIDVVKDIGLNYTTSSAATISIVDQNFSQTDVPEPASLTLFGSALLALGLLVSRLEVA
jgi:hypothetical protein